MHAVLFNCMFVIGVRIGDRSVKRELERGNVEGVLTTSGGQNTGRAPGREQGQASLDQAGQVRRLFILFKSPLASALLIDRDKTLEARLQFVEEYLLPVSVVDVRLIAVPGLGQAHLVYAAGLRVGVVI